MERSGGERATPRWLDREVYAPGDLVTARAEVVLRRPAEVKAVEPAIRCREVVRGWDLVGNFKAEIAVPLSPRQEV